MTEAEAIRVFLHAASWDDGCSPTLDYPETVDAFAALGVDRAAVDRVIDADEHLPHWRHMGLRLHPSWRVIDVRT